MLAIILNYTKKVKDSSGNGTSAAAKLFRNRNLYSVSKEASIVLIIALNVVTVLFKIFTKSAEIGLKYFVVLRFSFY